MRKERVHTVRPRLSLGVCLQHCCRGNRAQDVVSLLSAVKPDIATASVRRILTPPLSPQSRFSFAPGLYRPVCFQEAFGQLVLLGCRRHRLCTCSLSTSSSPTALKGDLILRLASCLDAFSTYPTRTLLPGSAAGATTGKQEVRPTRSSRTSVGSPQISNAHNR